MKHPLRGNLLKRLVALGYYCLARGRRSCWRGSSWSDSRTW